MNDTLAVNSPSSERELPALYMLRGGNAIVDPDGIRPAYDVLPLPMTRWREAHAVVELEWRVTYPAIRTYLRVGYRPFLHRPGHTMDARVCRSGSHWRDGHEPRRRRARVLI